MIELLDEGLEFYTEMLETLDKTYHIGLEQYYDVLEIRSSDTKIRCALVSAQKCLLCLGDLARYKEMIQNTSNYGKARQYYQKASHIDTRNAKPFNQLAILAWTAKRKYFLKITIVFVLFNKLKMLLSISIQLLCSVAKIDFYVPMCFYNNITIVILVYKQ